MIRRKFLSNSAVALSGATAFSFLGCTGNRKKQIGVVPKGRAHLFWQSVHAGAIKGARENDVEIIWNGPTTETDFNGQIQIVDSMINRHVDAICLAPIDKKVMVSIVERAASQNIPVVIFDSPVDSDKFISQVATDNFQAGQMAAERMGKILEGKGKVIIVAVQPGAASTMAREEGFETKIKSAFPGIEIVDKRYGMADFAQSMQVAENMLTAHPEAMGMFASNESSAVGGARALKQRRSKVKMVGFDWSPALLEDLRGGLIDSLVAQHPFKMGYESVIAAVKHLKGEKVEKINNLSPKLLTKDNLDSSEVQEQINPDLKKYLE